MTETWKGRSTCAGGRRTLGSKTRTVRRLFVELRQLMGPEVPAGEVLKLADALLQAYLDDKSDIVDFYEPALPRFIRSLPVDEAIRDGGWRVLEFERRTLSFLDEVDPQEIYYERAEIRRLMEEL